MAKMEYVKKQTTKICGLLDKNDNDEYIITVQDKDYVREFALDEIIDSMVGTLVCFSNEEIL